MRLERVEVATPAGRFVTLQAGDAGAPLALCLHGFPDHARAFEGMAPALVAAGYRIVAPWMRGYAPSTLAGPYGPDVIARDVLALAEVLSPSSPAHLVGHDWGAVAAYGAAALAPSRFRAMATLAVPHPLSFLRALRVSGAQRRRSGYMAFFQLPFFALRRVRRDDFAYIERLYRAWSPGYSPDPAYLRDLKDCLAASLPAPIQYYRAALPVTPGRAWRAPGFLRSLARIAVPTLYLHGEDDGCIGPEVAVGQQRYFAGPFRAVSVPGTGHFLNLEAPESVAAEVVAWFAAHRPA